MENKNSLLPSVQIGNPKTIIITKKNNRKNIRLRARNKQKEEYEKKKEIEKMKKEKELKEQIKDHLKCYICLSKVTKPKMCPYCKRICCEDCINQWLEENSFCGICKHNLSSFDLIEIPFLDEMSAFFIKDIDNQEKVKKMASEEESLKEIKDSEQKNFSGPVKIINLSNIKNIDSNIMNNKNNIFNLNNTNNNNINIMNNNMSNINNNNSNNHFNDNNINNDCSNYNVNTIQEEDDLDLCMEHGNNIEYYCVQCNKYFCSQCLFIFGTEVNKHNNHFIIKANSINDPKVKEVEDEYKKLPETKKSIESLMAECNIILKENEIKKYEIIKIMNYIQNFYLKNIDKETQKIYNSLKKTKILKNDFENNKNSILSNLSKILNPNYNNNSDQQQLHQMIQELKNLNNNRNSERNNIDINVIESTSNTPKLFLENYQTNIINIRIPILPNGLLNGDLIDYEINIIPNYKCRLNMKHQHGNVRISFFVYIWDDINSPSYPNFHAYITFKNQKYGLEFINLYENSTIKKSNNSNIGNTINEQISFIDLNDKQFLFLCDEQNKIYFKVYITKSFYK